MRKCCAIALGLWACVAAQAAQPSGFEMLKKLPPEVVARFVKLGGAPDANGLVGSNHRLGWTGVGLQRGAIIPLIVGAVRNDERLVAESWRAIDAAFAHQQADGSFELKPSEPGQELKPWYYTSDSAFWLCELSHGLLVLRESPLGAKFKERIAGLMPKIRLAAKRLADGREDLERHADGKSPNRLCIDANAFSLTGLLLGDERLKEIGRHFVERALALQREDGVFIERGGFDSSYQAVALLKLEVRSMYFPDAKVSNAIERGMKCELARIKPTGEVEVADNTRTGLGQEKFLGHEKGVNYGEVAQALLYHGVRCNKKDVIAIGERVLNFRYPK